MVAEDVVRGRRAYAPSRAPGRIETGSFLVRHSGVGSRVRTRHIMGTRQEMPLGETTPVIVLDEEDLPELDIPGSSTSGASLGDS